jgi:hypothetical protein
MYDVRRRWVRYSDAYGAHSGLTLPLSRAERGAQRRCDHVGLKRLVTPQPLICIDKLY